MLSLNLASEDVNDTIKGMLNVDWRPHLNLSKRGGIDRREGKQKSESTASPHGPGQSNISFNHPKYATGWVLYLACYR